jgi:hypothetical protein
MMEKQEGGEEDSLSIIENKITSVSLLVRHKNTCYKDARPYPSSRSSTSLDTKRVAGAPSTTS